jgi:pilus assembly protein CpaC
MAERLTHGAAHHFDACLTRGCSGVWRGLEGELIMTTLLPNTQLLRIAALLGTALLMLVISASAQAQAFAQETNISVSFNSPPKEPIPVYVLAGQSILVVFDQPIGRLAVSNTDVAEAVLVAPNQMMVNGKVSGRATFTAWSKDTSTFVFFNVDVRVNLAQIDSQVRALFPNMDIRLSQANGAVVVSGSMPPAIMKQVEEIVKAAGYKVVNLTGQTVEKIAQVQLSVKVAEISRSKLSEFAFAPAIETAPNYGGTFNTGSAPFSFGGTQAGQIIGSVASSLNVFFMSNNVFGYLRALQNQGALRALAEPNLVAMDGQQASFLAGGEIPVPIAQGGGSGGSAVTVVWKEYGVRLNFKPTILDEQHIRLDIEPEVSSLDFANAVRFQGFLIPALRVRRAKTGIELQNGQTFGIAGLLDNSETKSLGKIPVLGDVPIIGNLFKSKSFQRNESELVFIVTTKLVKPWNSDQVPQMKGVDGLSNGSPLGITTPEAHGESESKKSASGEAPIVEAGKEAKDAPTEQPPSTNQPANSTPPEPSAQPNPPGTPKPAEAEQPTAVPPANADSTAKPAEQGQSGNNLSPSTTPVETPPNGQPTGEPKAEPKGEPNDEKKPQNPTNPTGPTVKPTMERMVRPVQAVQALQWKLKVPSTATVTAQTRP